MSKRKALIFIIFVLLGLMSLPKLSVYGIRLSQAYTLVFCLVLVFTSKNIVNKRIFIKLVLFGAVLSAVSLLSSYGKIKEIGFIIKYCLVYPASFYVGSQILYSIGAKSLSLIIERAILLYAFFGVFMYFYPIQFIFNDRGGFTGFQGTFMESGWLAKAVLFSIVTATTIGIDFNAEKRTRFKKLFIFIVSLVVLILTKNTAVWIALILSIIFANLVLSESRSGWLASYQKNLSAIREVRKIKRKITYLAGALIVIVAMSYFFGFGSQLTLEDLAYKMEYERGLALLYGIDLLQKSDWVGMYGFGFVEYFFSSIGERVIGLGSGSAILFNSYLDTWISVGIFGVMYHIYLLKLSFNRNFTTTTVLPAVMFILCNVNPLIGSEYYYLFLGICFSIANEDSRRGVAS